MKKKFIVAAVVLILVAATFFIMRGNGTEDGSVSGGTTITYSDSGFSPEALVVGSGATITIENVSSKDLQVGSGPHPTHTANPELNNTDIAPPGTIQTITVTSRGTWSYHNHFDPGKTGKIIVE